ncbi:MAG: transposase [SAR324 cluster bacterium]|uniref:Transposase n=1 Tax=SAR324 cluster bacterium TaxID=2024889 RepID=A0A7X9FQY6_9DELT|nr:transposase [SAR324 cluster bacterium]
MSASLSKQARLFQHYPPQKRNRTIQRETNFTLYWERNLIERPFNKLKQFITTATRYDKLKSTILTAVQFASIIILLN